MPSTRWSTGVAARLGSALAPALSPLSPSSPPGIGAGDGPKRGSRRGPRARETGAAAGLAPRLVGRRRPAGARACCSSCAGSCPRPSTLYTHFSPSAEPLARRLRGRRGGLPALRPARCRGAAARRARPRPARLLQARSLARAGHPGGRPRCHRWPSWPPPSVRGSGRLAVGGAAPAPRRVSRGGPRRGRLRRGCGAARAARRGRRPIRVLGDPRFDSVLRRERARSTPRIRCSGSATARRRWSPAPPGRPTRTSCSTHSRRVRARTPMRG